MADFTALKEAIQDAIKQNGQKEITGEVLQTILLSMVSTLGDSAINDLVAALAAAVTTLQNSVGDEAAARQSAVGTLTHNLNTEAQTRAYEDNQLNTAIQGEAYTRGQADNQIRQDFTEALGEETAARINGDSTLTHNLNVEAQARAAAILNEATLRQGEDYQLRLQINGLSMDFDRLLEDVRQMIRGYEPIIINGNVVNAPDENDITTTSNNLLKFKDKAYNPIMFSGMGKKFLRKNLRPLSDSYPFDGFVENITPQEEFSGTPTKIYWDREGERFVGWVDGVYYLAWTGDDAYVPVSTSNIYMYDGNPYRWNGTDFYVDDQELPNVRNILTQDMISEANTIYVIRYDYTLAEDITIPANCVLEFDGGSLSNGTIIGNSTGIINNSNSHIFKESLQYGGGINFEYFDIRWFGAIPFVSNDENFQSIEDIENAPDCHNAFQMAVDWLKLHHYSAYIKVVGGYRLATTVDIGKSLYLKGQSTCVNVQLDGEMIPREIASTSTIYVPDGVTAFNIHGRVPYRGAITVENMRFYGVYGFRGSDWQHNGWNVGPTTLFKSSVNYGPGRPVFFINSYARDFYKVFDLDASGVDAGDTTYWFIDIRDSRIERNEYAIYIHSKDNKDTCGLVNVSGCALTANHNIIDITGVRSYISFKGNGCEQIGGGNISLNSGGKIDIIGNYFELTYGDLNITGANFSNSVRILQNEFYTGGISKPADYDNAAKIHLKGTLTLAACDMKYGLVIDGTIINTGNAVELPMILDCLSAQATVQLPIPSIIYEDSKFVPVKSYQSQGTINVGNLRTGYILNSNAGWTEIINGPTLNLNDEVIISFYKTKGNGSIRFANGNIYAVEERALPFDAGAYAVKFKATDSHWSNNNRVRVFFRAPSDRSMELSNILYANITQDTQYILGMVCPSISENNSGPTAKRLHYDITGLRYFDTTLNKPIFWNGTAWVDATGATV